MTYALSILIFAASFLFSFHAAQALPRVAVLPSVTAPLPPTPEEIPALSAKAAQGDVAAQTRLGWWHLVNKEVERARELLQKAAASGNAEAQYHYALTLSLREDVFDPTAQDAYPCLAGKIRQARARACRFFTGPSHRTVRP